jgi:hypothetical protein
VWRDLGADERTDLAFPPPDPSVDITRFALTSDASYLYILAQFTNVDGLVMPQLQVAIDIDHVTSSGQTFLANFADTQVAAEAAWEFLVMTRFGSGNSTPAVFTAEFADVATPASASSARSTGANGVIEIQVPWSDLGLSGDLTAPLRFTVATFRTDALDNTVDIGGSSVSNALDVVTNYGDPGATSNTFAELMDQDIDYYFDVWFHLDPEIEPSAPALLSEIYYDPPGTESDQEWIEVYNRTGLALPIDAWLLGDEETIGMAEGMAFFPSGSVLAQSQAAVVALRATGFLAFTGLVADYEFVSTDAGVPDMTAAATWAIGAIALSNSGDEVLLLDRQFTILDAATFETSSYPGVTPHPGTVDQSLERNVDFDRDDCALDFAAQPTPTPKVPLASATTVPTARNEERASLEATTPNPMTSGTRITFALRESGSATVRIVDVQGRIVRRLLDRQISEGSHNLQWDGRNESGERVAAGVYFALLVAHGENVMRAITVVR